METLHESELGKLLCIRTQEAFDEIAQGTAWCEDDNEPFNLYSEEHPFYVWIDDTGEKYLFFFGEQDFFIDEDPRYVSERNIYGYGHFMFNDEEREPIDYETLRSFAFSHPILSELFADEEKKMLESGDAFRAREYANFVIRGAWPKAEGIISQVPKSAAYYAIFVLERRWPEGEAAIREDRDYWDVYLHNVDVRERWDEYEKYLLGKVHCQHGASSAVDYARDVIKGRWPKLEELLFAPKWYGEEGQDIRYRREVIDRYGS